MNNGVREGKGTCSTLTLPLADSTLSSHQTQQLTVAQVHFLMLEIISETVNFLVYLKPQCSAMHSAPPTLIYQQGYTTTNGGKLPNAL